MSEFVLISDDTLEYLLTEDAPQLVFHYGEYSVELINEEVLCGDKVPYGFEKALDRNSFMKYENATLLYPGMDRNKYSFRFELLLPRLKTLQLMQIFCHYTEMTKERLANNMLELYVPDYEVEYDYLYLEDFRYSDIRNEGESMFCIMPYDIEPPEIYPGLFMEDEEEPIEEEEVDDMEMSYILRFSAYVL